MRVCAESLVHVNDFIDAFPKVKEGDSLFFIFEGDGEQVEVRHGSTTIYKVCSQDMWIAMQGVWLDCQSEAPALRTRLLQKFHECVFCGIMQPKDVCEDVRNVSIVVDSQPNQQCQCQQQCIQQWPQPLTQALPSPQPWLSPQPLLQLSPQPQPHQPQPHQQPSQQSQGQSFHSQELRPPQPQQLLPLLQLQGTDFLQESNAEQVQCEKPHQQCEPVGFVLGAMTVVIIVLTIMVLEACYHMKCHELLMPTMLTLFVLMSSSYPSVLHVVQSSVGFLG